MVDNFFHLLKQFKLHILITVCTLPYLFMSLGNYAKNDDYVFLGISLGEKWDFQRAAGFFFRADWNAGRWITNIFAGSIFSTIESVGSLVVIRLLSFVIILLIVNFHIKFMQELNFSSKSILLSSLALLSIPGIAAFLTLASALPYLLSVLMGLTVSFFLTEKEFRLNGLNSWMAIAGAFTLSFLYQPAIFLVIIYPLLEVCNNKVFSRYFLSRSLIFAGALALAGSLVNLLSGRLLVISGRSNFEIPSFDTVLEFILNVLFRAMIPWNFPPINQNFMLDRYPIRFFLIILFLLITTELVTKKPLLKLKGILRVFMYSFLGLFFTLSWALPLVESSLDYRRYMFGSIVFWIVFSASILETNLNLQNVFSKITTFLVLCSIISFNFASTLDSGIRTKAYNQIEWKSYLCASSQVKLNSNDYGDRSLVSDFMQSSMFVSDDFETYSSVFPNPPGFMMYLSQREIYPQQELPSIWNLGLVRDGDIIRTTESGVAWSLAQQKCFRMEHGIRARK
jgi:hypothetical protein